MRLVSLFILLFWGSIQTTFAQDNCQRSYCDWEFFDLEETIEGEVLYHEMGTCGHRAITSITILKVKNDTIRVLSYCDERSYDIGEKIYVINEAIISRFNFRIWVAGIPVKKKRGWRKEYKKAQAQLPSRFDKLVLKTTIGVLSDQSDCQRKLNVYKRINNNSFQCLWNFFQIEEPLEGKIIKYQAQTQACHLIAYASLAIVAIHNN